MALQHKSKLRIYKELKCGFGFEEYSQLVKGPSSRLLLKLHSGTHELFEEQGRHAKGGGSQECLIVALVRSLLRMFTLSVHRMIPKGKVLATIMKQILSPEAFKAFNYSSVFDNAVFCLG